MNGTGPGWAGVMFAWMSANWFDLAVLYLVLLFLIAFFMIFGSMVQAFDSIAKAVEKIAENQTRGGGGDGTSI